MGGESFVGSNVPRQFVFFCSKQVCSELLFPVVPQLESMRLWSFVTMTRHASWGKVNLTFSAQFCLLQWLCSSRGRMGSAARVLYKAW